MLFWTVKIVNLPELDLIRLSFSIIQTLEFSFEVEWGVLNFNWENYKAYCCKRTHCHTSYLWIKGHTQQKSYCTPLTLCKCMGPVQGHCTHQIINDCWKTLHLVRSYSHNHHLTFSLDSEGDFFSGFQNASHYSICSEPPLSRLSH